LNKVLKVSFPLPPTLNQIIKVARDNKYKSAKSKKEWTSYVENCCKSIKVKFSGKVWLDVCFHTQTRRNDPDNLMAGLKPILDGLVNAKIIVDDSITIIQSPIIQRFVRTKGINSVVLTFSDKPIYQITEIDYE
jgi:Holliday junction resolvase RusA-like endonuclease